MRIQNSDLRLAAQHQASKTEEVEQKVTAWSGSQRSQASFTQSAESASVRISEFAQALRAAQASTAGNQAQTAAPVEQANTVSEDDDQPLDPKLQVLKDLIERLTGRPIKLAEFENIRNSLQNQQSQEAAPASSASSARPARQGWGMEIESVHRYSEKEEVHFQASGRISTEDNRQIEFNLEFSMKREFSIETRESVRLGDAKRVDPLILNFSNQAPGLTENKFEFDLNADGKKEKISFPVGSGFLALDRNNDGKINNGSELFGPGSGDGFADLSKFDSDGNNWIDENDAVYQQLRIWSKDASGNDQLQTLKLANVGALYLGKTATPFSLNNSDNLNLGQVRSSGVFLSEDGKAHALQQIDLSV